MASSKLYEPGPGNGTNLLGDNDRILSSTGDDGQDTTPDMWLSICRDAYRTSEDYFDANIRNEVEQNLAHFNSTHAPGSKYFSDTYKYRAKGFRPKTRSVVRKNETAAAVALFSTADMVSVTPHRGTDKAQTVSAEINQELLQYRLDNTVPWFRTTMGAYQDTLVAGVSISYQSWDYREIEKREVVVDPETGMDYLDEMGNPAETVEYEVVADTPSVDLRPIENVLFSTAADWRDPINTSPFLIDRMSMTIDEVMTMVRQDGKTNVPWVEVTEGMLLSGLTEDYDPVRAARENNRTDSEDQSFITSGFETVYIHRNIIRKDGEDWLIYTLGDHLRLSDPIPLRDEYPWLMAGQRPYVLGVSTIETHKNYPTSLTGMVSNLQQEANNISNQRRDNVSLVLNRRYLVKRGKRINVAGLQRNIPGDVTMVDDTVGDIRMEAPPDVTASSYEEQDRLNMDYDELAGSFSTSSVAGNRQLNETVGGMNLLNNDANSVTEYQLRVFVETWVEPVLKQLIQLEQMYETDEAILNMIGEKVQLWNRFGVSEVHDDMLQGNMNVKVNVGFGATDPQQRVNKLVFGLNTVMQFAPQIAARLDHEEVATEVFGALGYSGADRFFPQPDEEQQAAMQQPPTDPRMEIEKFKAQAQMEIEKMRAMEEQGRLQMEAELRTREMQTKSEMAEREAQLKQMLAEYELQSDIMELSAKKELTIEQIKAKLGEVSIKERGQNERFLAERSFAETTGEGRGL